jgi:hypothetical protein
LPWLTALLAALLACAGCVDGNPFKPLDLTPTATIPPPPTADTPQNLMELFRWCWVNQQISEYENLFTDDFRFVFTDVEAVDNPPILRQEAIDITRRIIADARRIDLTFYNPLIPIPDTRPNKPTRGTS